MSAEGIRRGVGTKLPSRVLMPGSRTQLNRKRSGVARWGSPEPDPFRESAAKIGSAGGEPERAGRRPSGGLQTETVTTIGRTSLLNGNLPRRPQKLPIAESSDSKVSNTVTSFVI